MAEAVNTAVEAAREPSSPPRRRRRRRFVVAYAVLGILVAAAATALALLLPGPGEEPRSAPAPAWSSWRPTATGIEGAEQIANYVAPRYRLPSGRQLVAVRATPFEVEDVAISAVAVPSGGGDDLRVRRVENGVAFAMCGLGRACSISEGKPTQERGRLVRREALELSLYTLKYLKDVDSVVTFLPPARPTGPAYAVYYERRDLREQLDRPLGSTLSRTLPLVPTQTDLRDATIVDGLTVPRLFGFGFQQLQDGTAMLVLTPPPDEQ